MESRTLPPTSREFKLSLAGFLLSPYTCGNRIDLACLPREKKSCKP